MIYARLKLKIIMDYSALSQLYERLESTASKLGKTDILADFLRGVPEPDIEKVVLLVRGTVFPGSAQAEIGVAEKLVIRSIAKATGFKDSDVVEKFKRTGDLGLAVEECLASRKQATLMRKRLTVDLVFSDLRKLADMTGSGSQDRKLDLIAEMIVCSKPVEARYIIRTILSNLRVGASDGIIRDSIAAAFLDGEKKESVAAVEHAMNLVSDIGEVARLAKHGGMSALMKSKAEVGKPIQVMLAEKAESIDEVMKKYGRVAIEWKFDGMRAQIHKKGERVWVYTRRQEDVTRQFPDIVELVRKGVKCDECIIEGEALGVDRKTGQPLPFQVLSQRVHRKYDIERMVDEIPIQVNIFDAIYVDGEMLLDRKFLQRRDVLKKVVKPISGKFQLAKQLITSDPEQAAVFYEMALKHRQEGVMMKVLESNYVFGRHVDGWVKIKPVMETLDLAVVGATWGEGSRANWLTSFVLACRDGEKFEECGMMSTGLTEDEYKEITDLLRPLIVDENGKEVTVRPKIVVEVGYQEIQKSPNYSSGFALRFPSFKNLRFDKGPEDVDGIGRVKKLYKSQGRAG